MPKYRFKDNEMTFSDIMNIFQQFEDVYTELHYVLSCLDYAEKLHTLIIELNEDIEIADVEMYDEEKNGAIVFSIRSKYKCLRAISYAKMKIMRDFYDFRYREFAESKLHNLAFAYINALEYFFTYSYIVRDEKKSALNWKEVSDTLDRLTIRQPNIIPCDGEDMGV